MGSSLNSDPFWCPFCLKRVPYYIGDLKRDPNLENYLSELGRLILIEFLGFRGLYRGLGI